MQILIPISFFVVSATSFLPYNLFMNAHEYFYFKLHNTSIFNGTDFKPIAEETVLQRKFEGYLSLFGGVACIIGAAVNLLLTTHFRVYAGHALVLLSLIPTIFYTYTDTDDYQQDFFNISLILASLASFGSIGLIGGGIMGLVSGFPSHNLKAVLFGQSAAGICATVLSIVCQITTSDLIWNGRIYFLIATCWTLMSILFYRYVSIKSKTPYDSDSDSEDDTNALIRSDSDPDLNAVRTVSDKDLYMRTLSKSKYSLACLMLTLTITLSAFPGVASLVKSVSHSEAWIGYFSSICCFLAFNVGDGCGRALSGMKKMGTKWLTIFCLLRCVFIPLIIICNIHPRYHTPTLLPYDGVFLLVILLFGITHGHTFSIAVDNITGSVDPECGEVSGSIINLASVLSAFIGSFIGIGLVTLL
ncbi:unnamed protein product [Auanema sp. JU1783]|nr:unnamed protein product [Auanema sp. JU1783]